MGYIIQNFNQKRQFLCNVTHTCIKFFTKTIQIIQKKTLHTSIISESIKVLVKKYYREVIEMLSKDFIVYHKRKMSLP